jgi:hypothetical protein
VRTRLLAGRVVHWTVGHDRNASCPVEVRPLSGRHD